MTLLKQEAKRLRISVNMLIIKILARDLGFSYKKLPYYDLDHLAGSWSSSEENLFTENSKYFKKLDKDLWP
jgi:hypothetical protein